MCWKRCFCLCGGGVSRVFQRLAREVVFCLQPTTDDDVDVDVDACVCVCVCFIQATYLVDCITDKAKSNKILNIGGPDDGLTMTAQGKLVRRSLPSAERETRAGFRLHTLRSKARRFEESNTHHEGVGGVCCFLEFPFRIPSTQMAFLATEFPTDTFQGLCCVPGVCR